MNCLEVKIDADGILIDTRESEVRDNGEIVYGWDALWEETKSLSDSERELGRAWLKEVKGYYDRAKQARIERERERGDRRMMRECRNMLKLFGAAHGIGNAEDKKALEAERKRRTMEEETESTTFVAVAVEPGDLLAFLISTVSLEPAVDPAERVADLACRALHGVGQ